jgi:hypothetical protein
MKRPKPILKQPMTKELKDSCLGILRSKFYAGDDKCFFQDQRDLLRWVVLYMASWLYRKGVTIHGDRYREIFSKVFLQAAAHVRTKIKYRPVYLRQVIEDHLKHHGEKYYEEAKATRNLVDQQLEVLGKMRINQPDPVRELAEAAKILAAVNPKKTTSKAVVKQQLNLFS